jgi:hypothetical protein
MSLFLALVCTKACADVYVDAGYRQEMSAVQQCINNIPCIPELLFVGAWIYHCFAKEKPQPNWGAGTWRAYLRKKLRLDTEQDFIYKAIHYYRGYRYEGFCRLIGDFVCDESLFDDVRAFVRSPELSTPLRRYYNEKLKSDYRQNFSTGVEYIVQRRVQLEEYRLEQEGKAERERVDREIKARQQQEHNQQTYNRALQQLLKDQRSTIVSITHEYECREWSPSVPCPVMERRVQGLHEHIKDAQTISRQRYTLSPTVVRTLKTYGIGEQVYQVCVGSPLQHILHTECIALIDTGAALERSALQATVIECVELGRLHNQAGYIESALKALDLCWSLVQCSAQAGRAIVTGFVQGTYQAGASIAGFVFAPVESITEYLDTLHNASCELVRFLDQHCVLLETPYSDEPITIGLVACADRTAMVAQHMLDYGRAHPYDAIRETTSLLTQAHLTSKTLEIMASLFSRSANQLKQYLQKVKEGTLSIGNQEIPALVVGQAAEMMTSDALAGQISEAKMSGLVAQASGAALSMQLHQALEPLRQEIPALRKLFDGTRKGFGELATKYIKIPYEHVLGIDFWTKKRFDWAGFHHDFMGTIEKSGLATVVKKTTITSEGFYEADIIINGVLKKNKTFFPQHWTREKVISKILEAYDDFIVKGAKTFELCSDGKYEFEGLTSEGIKIQLYLTKNGQITSAYPLLR